MIAMSGDMGDWKSIAGIIAASIPLVVMRLSCAQHDAELEKILGRAVLDALDATRLTVKEAAPLMHVDESNLRSMLRGESKYHIGIVHLARLPFSFWTVFGPALFFLLAKRNVTALAESMDLRKAS